MGYIVILAQVTKMLIDTAGVFNSSTKKIPSGTFIGVYSGELLTDTVSEQRGL